MDKKVTIEMGPKEFLALKKGWIDGTVKGKRGKSALWGLVTPELADKFGFTTRKARKMVKEFSDVSQMTAYRSRIIYENGLPELLEAVRGRKLSVNTGYYIAKMSTENQRTIMAIDNFAEITKRIHSAFIDKERKERRRDIVATDPKKQVNGHAGLFIDFMKTFLSKEEREEVVLYWLETEGGAKVGN